MNDILNKELRPMDLVFVMHASNSGVTLELALVVGFTKTLVKYESNYRGRKKASHNMMKTNVEDARLYIENRFNEERELQRWPEDRYDQEFIQGRIEHAIEQRDKLNELIERHLDAQ